MPLSLKITARFIVTVEFIAWKTAPEPNNVLSFFSSIVLFAENAAIAALAASRQNKYRELSALMMQNYSQLSEQTIRHYAQQIGLNMESFDSAIKDPELLKQVKADLQESTRCNVSGVPSIFINGRPIKSYTVESFSEMINEELRKKK